MPRISVERRKPGEWCWCRAARIQVDGICSFRCPIETSPEYKSEVRRLRLEREMARKRDEKLASISHEDKLRTSEAVRRIDPIARHMWNKAVRGGRRSHAAGCTTSRRRKVNDGYR